MRSLAGRRVRVVLRERADGQPLTELTGRWGGLPLLAPPFQVGVTHDDGSITQVHADRIIVIEFPDGLEDE